MLPPAKTDGRPEVSLAEYELWEKGAVDALTCFEDSCVKTCREMGKNSITLKELTVLIRVCKTATLDRSSAIAQAVNITPEAKHE